MTGRVKALRASYGFIAADDGRDVFFHVDDCCDPFDLKVGDEVSFEPEVPAPAQGPRARGISFVAGARS